MSPLSEISRPPATWEYSAEERAILLRAARDSVRAAVERLALAPVVPSSHLAELRGVFTTLYHRGTLRGCVGFPFPVSPLYRAVVETARAAALEDPRFAPVERLELPEIKISLSIMSSLRRVAADEVEPGRHGLLISDGPRRGLLLPQVAVEHSWDRETFLRHTCMKAGLPPDRWSEGARIEVFTAEVFEDEAGASNSSIEERNLQHP